MPRRRHTDQNDRKFVLAGIRHPDYLDDSIYWEHYRDTYNGGHYFRRKYLKKFSSEERSDDFQRRLEMTPIPSFAKQALNEVRNSIFQRLPDVTRLGGTPRYSEAMRRNVDRKYTPMNKFIGVDVLTELLVIGRVGIYVDAPAVLPTTLADNQQNPYLYTYPVEDILSWVEETEENLGQFKSVLLRDRVIEYDDSVSSIELPSGRGQRFRLIYRDDFGDVRVKMFDEDENIIWMDNSDEDGSVKLNLPFVPFIMPDIGDSLLKDVWTYQVALLNIASGAVNFDISSNVPFLTIQEDLRTAGSHLKRPVPTPGVEPNNQVSKENIVRTGSTRGQYYDRGTDRPEFIAPPSDPLKASLEHQAKLQDDIRHLVNLAVQSKAGSRTESAAAKKVASQSFEAGLSFIGTVLEAAEQQIAYIWSFYEDSVSPQPASINYPSSYSVKSDEERMEESVKLLNIADRTPSNLAKKTAYKKVVSLLLEGCVSNQVIERIHAEIDNARYTRSDMEFVLEAREAGLLSDETAAEALGINPVEVEQAAEDHAERLRRIAISQMPGGGAAASLENPAGRGIPDADVDTNSGSVEQNNEE